MATANPLEQLRRRMQSQAAPAAFASLAEEHRRAGRLADAITVCRDGLGRCPAYVSARVTLGRALLDSGDIDRALIELEQAVTQAPDNLAAARALEMARTSAAEASEGMASQDTTADQPTEAWTPLASSVTADALSWLPSDTPSGEDDGLRLDQAWPSEPVAASVDGDRERPAPGESLDFAASVDPGEAVPFWTSPAPGDPGVLSDWGDPIAAFDSEASSWFDAPAEEGTSVAEPIGSGAEASLVRTADADRPQPGVSSDQPAALTETDGWDVSVVSVVDEVFARARDRSEPLACHVPADAPAAGDAEPSSSGEVAALQKMLDAVRARRAALSLKP